MPKHIPDGIGARLYVDLHGDDSDRARLPGLLRWFDAEPFITLPGFEDSELLEPRDVGAEVEPTD